MFFLRVLNVLSIQMKLIINKMTCVCVSSVQPNQHKMVHNFRTGAGQVHCHGNSVQQRRHPAWTALRTHGVGHGVRAKTHGNITYMKPSLLIKCSTAVLSHSFSYSCLYQLIFIVSFERNANNKRRGHSLYFCKMILTIHIYRRSCNHILLAEIECKSVLL